MTVFSDCELHVTIWTLDNDSAQLKQQRLSAALPLDQLSRGLVGASFSGVPLGWKKWLAIADARHTGLVRQYEYTRGNDLVCRYAGESDQGITLETSWQLLEADPSSVGLELLISVQDNPTGEEPVVTVGTTGQVDECLVLDADAMGWSRVERVPGSIILESPAAILCRWSDRDFSYLEMLHPADLRAGELGWGPEVAGELAWTLQLMHHQLEKGVIRRSRIQAWLIARDADQHLAEGIFMQFRDADCPLGS